MVYKEEVVLPFEFKKINTYLGPGSIGTSCGVIGSLELLRRYILHTLQLETMSLICDSILGQ